MGYGVFWVSMFNQEKRWSTVFLIKNPTILPAFKSESIMCAVLRTILGPKHARVHCCQIVYGVGYSAMLKLFGC